LGVVFDSYKVHQNETPDNRGFDGVCPKAPAIKNEIAMFTRFWANCGQFPKSNGRVRGPDTWH
jgi:hypothetical protein